MNGGPILDRATLFQVVSVHAHKVPNQALSKTASPLGRLPEGSIGEASTRSTIYSGGWKSPGIDRRIAGGPSRILL